MSSASVGCPHQTNWERTVSDARDPDNHRQEVVVVDVKIPFTSMVILLVKWAIAAIPAVIILIVLVGIISTIFGGVFHWGMWRGGMV